MFQYDETKTLRSIDIPVLVICGDSDIATTPPTSLRMKAELPQAELVTIQKGRHMALMEHNQQFAEAVRAFCTEIS
ncbi:alpha/beta hydrolase [Microcoleus sp. A2-C5]|uniref:alpha/beta fold hydrolase n=1 Tax=Microcoleaceae TaxID=1892252 RepID=UPI002238FF99|nr:alpha/beta hydrolase [Lyngbya sp. CCAP 1446/10]